MKWFGAQPSTEVTGVGVKELLPGQLEILEGQLERQESAMANRLSSASTRATLLIGASAVLGGTELVTASGELGWMIVSLVLYGLAAVAGLAAARSTKGEEPDLPVIVQEYASFKTISLRRELLLARLKSHDKSVVGLNGRHGWLVFGFVVLAAAWISSGIGTAIGASDKTTPPPTEIRIVE
jgi:hypothetical protein